MPISLKVQTDLDDRSVKDTTDKAQSIFDGIGKSASESFISGLNAGMGRAGDIFSGVSDAAASMGASVEAGALLATAGIAAMAFAAVKVGDELYSVGERFDNIFDNLAARTGKAGDELNSLEDSIRRVGDSTASSFEQIGDIAGRLSQSFNLTGQPLEDLTKRIADLNRLTGENLNIREFGQLLRGFDIDGSNAASVLNELLTVTQQTGIPMGELVSSLQSAGPAARILGLNLEETASMMVSFEKSGLDASNTTMALSHASALFAEKNIDLKTGLADTITQMKGFIDANNEAAAVTLAKDVFGARAARNFVDAVKDGTLTVKSLHDGLGPVGDTVTNLDNQTRDWSENWRILKNNVTDVAEAIGGPLFDAINQAFGKLNDFFSALIQGPPKITPGAPGDNSGQALGDLLGAPPGAPLPGQPGFIGPVPVTPGTVAAPPGTSGDLTGVLPPLIMSDRPPGGPPQDIAGAIAADQGGAGGSGPQIPYPAEYTAGPLPGESAQQYSQRMNQIEADHRVAQAQAEVDAIKADNTATADQIQKAENDLARAVQQQQETRMRNAQTGKGIDVAIPYSPDFGLGPQPGETTQIYSARTALLQAQHKAAEELAKLNQMETSGLATQNEIINQKNKVLEAQRAQQAAEMRLNDAYKSQMEKTTKGFEEIGSVLDRDLGISKGLPGLAENLVRFLATLGAAPVLGALGAVSQAQGGINVTGSGLIGMAGSMGAFGPQYQLGGFDQNGRPISLAQMQASGGATPAAYSGGGYMGDAALLSNVPAGRYAQVQAADLTKGLGDCTSSIEDLVNILDGRSTAGRSLFTNTNTGGPAGDWLLQHGFMPTNRPMPGTFQVGYNSGHMQATLPGGTPFNWGSDSAAANRGVGGSGAWDPAFTSHYYRPFGSDGAYAPLSPQQLTNPNLMQPTLYDAGGILPPGPTLVQNNTGMPETVLPPGVPANQAPNIAGGPGGGGPAPGPEVGQQGATTIGGAEPRPQKGGSAAAGGGLVSAATGAAAMAADMFAPGSGAAVQIASQEIQRAIKFGAQAAGIGVGGLMETFLPSGGSQLANNNWLTRIGGAVAGMAPQLPNMAGKAASPASTTQPAPPALTGQHAGSGAPPGPQTGVHIENYNVVAGEDRAGQDLARHQMAAAGPAGAW